MSTSMFSPHRCVETFHGAARLGFIIRIWSGLVRLVTLGVTPPTLVQGRGLQAARQEIPHVTVRSRPPPSRSTMPAGVEKVAHGPSDRVDIPT
jgi:hypothetical protein